ncbi:MAG: glucose 1-dehydrogenase [SAR202 cluster bacterium]|nr:glucose 1-dehydrogenase [SAR202 cluster bacterium]
MAKQFEGKVALVTGGGSGIGRTTALTFAREGARVVSVDIKLESAEETTHMIEKAGGKGIAVKTDVSLSADVDAMVKATVKKYGRLDFAFNNAGIGSQGRSTVDHTEEYFDRTIAINLKGVWLCMKYEIPQMLKQGGGCIVNTASIMGVVGIDNSAAYVAAKHGVVGLTRVAALENARHGVRVNAICPGVVKTPLNDEYSKLHPDVVERNTARTPLGRYGATPEIAEAVVWLCSDGASFVHGHPMVVDGAWTAQ